MQWILLTSLLQWAFWREILQFLCQPDGGDIEELGFGGRRLTGVPSISGKSHKVRVAHLRVPAGTWTEAAHAYPHTRTQLFANPDQSQPCARRIQPWGLTGGPRILKGCSETLSKEDQMIFLVLSKCHVPVIPCWCMHCGATAEVGHSLAESTQGPAAVTATASTHRTEKPVTSCHTALDEANTTLLKVDC